jgi:ABC-2 type transport system permease protein
VSSLTGTGKLIRLILRRDRVLTPIWVLWMAVIPISFISTYDKLYPTAADRLSYAKTSGSNPVFLALYGPLPNTSLGGIVAQRVGAIPIFVGLISLLTVIRHTRTEEQAGRRELLGSTVVGRHAGLAAALIVTMAANLVLALIMGAGMGGKLPASGAWALALSFAAAGWAFAAIGGVAAQLTENAGSARGLAISVLGGSVLLAIAGDLNGEGSTLSWLAWLSPLGWVRRMHPFANERWWILALALILVVVAAVAAVALSARRDVGSGILPARLGPAAASRRLRSSLALAWRLHQTLLLGWIIAFIVLGAVFGGIAEGIGDLMKDNQALKDLVTRIGGQKGLIDGYLASTMGLLGLIASAYGIQATLRLRAEEEAARAEYLLATSVSRVRWVASHLIFSAIGPAVVLAFAGVSAGLAHGANTGDIGGEVPRVLGGAMLQLPAVWVLTGLAVALFGLLPRMASAGAWAVLGLFLMLTLFGQGLQLNQGLLDISPFTHIPRIPGGDFSLMPVIWLLVISVLLTAAGLAGARRRDLGAA